MDANSLEARVATLERSVRRGRRTTATLALAALIAAAGAFAQQPVPSLAAQLEERLEARLESTLQTTLAQQVQEQVATQRLALTNESNVELVILQGDTDGSLRVLTPDGREVVRLGGPAARRIGH